LDAHDDRHIWARSYDCHVGAVLSVQRELACAIARQIQVSLTRRDEDRLGRTQPIRPEALTACLRGRYYWHQYFTETGMQQAMACFQQALQIEPGYAQAWAWLSACHSGMAVQSMAPPGRAAVEARRTAERALELDPLLPDAHLATAAVKLFFDWDWVRVERTIAAANELSPSYPMGHSLFTHYAAARGWGDHAIASARGALELDPMSGAHNTDLGWAFLLNGDLEQAREQLSHVLAMEFPFPLALVYLGQVCLQEGKFQEALDWLQRSLPPDGCGPPPMVAMLGHARAAAGDIAGARQSLETLDEMSAQAYVSPLDRAVVYAGIGDDEQALDWLERAFEDHSPRVIWIKLEPAFQGLRTQPRFEDMVRRVEAGGGSP
jgi:tetratricopeptide (TPR) repeat protein